MLRDPWVLAATAAEIDAEARARLRERAGGSGMLLATCHRVELYGVGVPPQLPAPIRLHGEAAVERLFRVAAGLESAVVGEDEVLHQVRHALIEARGKDGQAAPDARLSRLCEEAIATGRRVRSGRRSPKTGLAERAVAWLAERADLEGRRVLVAGTGVMGRALARAVAATGATVVTASRDGGRAELDLEQAALAAPDMAGVAVALAGPWQALASVERPLPPLADLSSPPATPPTVRAVLGERLLDIDQLFEQAPVEAAWLERAERLVAEGVAAYVAWLQGREAVDVLRALQARSEERRRARVERLLRRLPDLGDEHRDALEQLSRQLVKDLLHEPLVALRSDTDGSRHVAARRLFGL